VPLREETLWRMLYETAARASEVLGLNIEDLDLDARRAPVRSKGGDTEWICWGSGTAHLLPRLIRGRQAGPVFLSARRAGPACRPAAKDLCPATGRARLGYDRARILFTRYTGRELHQLRPCRDSPRRARHPLAADHGQDPAPQPAHRDAVRPPWRRSRR
jgi:integrase